MTLASRSGTLLVLALGLSLFSTACTPRPVEEARVAGDAATAEDGPEIGADLNIRGLESERARISYMVGMDIGQSLSQIKGDLDPAVIQQAIRDVFEGRPTKLTDEQAAAIRSAYSQRVQSRLASEAAARAADNLRAGTEFLAQNKTKPGVVTTASGLQYEVLTAGEGPRPAPEAVVSVHYRGTLLDGTEFDSSIARGEPAEFPLNQVIPGWTEGVGLMNVGSKYRFWIPSELAYGPNGAGEAIPPNSALVFEVELLGIMPAGGQPQAPAQP
jgi:FKBP-type peptidyl-prolyl cis-trans isomerase